MFSGPPGTSNSIELCIENSRQADEPTWALTVQFDGQFTLEQNPGKLELLRPSHRYLLGGTHGTCVSCLRRLQSRRRSIVASQDGPWCSRSHWMGRTFVPTCPSFVCWSNGRLPLPQSRKPRWRMALHPGACELLPAVSETAWRILAGVLALTVGLWPSSTGIWRGTPPLPSARFPARCHVARWARRCLPPQE